MSQEHQPNSAPRAASLAVDWHDCAWVPAIVVQTPPAHRRRDKTIARVPPVSHTDRRSPTTSKTMKTIFVLRAPSARGLHPHRTARRHRHHRHPGGDVAGRPAGRHERRQEDQGQTGGAGHRHRHRAIRFRLWPLPGFQRRANCGGHGSYGRFHLRRQRVFQLRSSASSGRLYLLHRQLPR